MCYNSVKQLFTKNTEGSFIPHHKTCTGEGYAMHPGEAEKQITICDSEAYQPEGANKSERMRMSMPSVQMVICKPATCRRSISFACAPL